MSQPLTRLMRTNPEQFQDLAFARRHPVTMIDWPGDGLAETARLAVIDEVPTNSMRGTFLLLHGEPTWSALYERWIPRLTSAGYRCVAIDLPGFGRSDKPLDDDWYTYERHCAAVAHVIGALDLTDVRLVVQDWAGPIGLRQVVDQPTRFSRLYGFNTWLHHRDYDYSDGIRRWRASSTNPNRLGGNMPTGAIVASALCRPDHDPAEVQRIFGAPFTTYQSKAGARAFPTILPFEQPERGGAVEQERCYHWLAVRAPWPIHLAFGDSDIVFTYDHGQAWADQVLGATIDRIGGAGHFVQYDAPDDCLAIISRYEQCDI